MPKKPKKRTAAKPSPREEKQRAPEKPYEGLLARTPTRRRELINIGILFCLALLVRTVYFFINKNHNPLFEHPILDALFHHEWAEEILAGNFWGDEVFFRAPLYPYFLAFLYKISGESIAFATYVQHIIGALNVALVYVLARRFFTVRVAVVAGVLAALYWPLIYFEGDLLIVTLAVFLDLITLILLTLSVDRQSTRLFLASGLVLGLSAIARPSILILIPVLPFVFHLSRRAVSTRRDRLWLRQTVLVIAGSLVVILPVIVRNYVIGRDIVPIASQGGVNFYIGNNPQANGSLAMVPGARADMYGTYHGAIELAEADVGRKLKPSEVSNYYTKKALAFIAGSPAQAARLFAKKLYLFWAGQERSNNKFIQFFWDRFGLGRIPLPGFWLVGPLALLGGVLLWRQRRSLSLLYLFVVAYMVGVVIFFVNGRFRLPVTPVLIIFAAYGLQHLVVSVRTRSTDLLKGLLILGVCAFIVDYDYISFRGVRSLDEAISYYELGNAYLRLGNEDGALAEYEKAHAVQTRYPTRGYAQIAGTVDYNIGAIYWQKGLYARAIEALERVPKNDPRAGQAEGMLADCYLKRGRTEDAIRIYKSILADNPLDLRILFGLGIAYRMTGNYQGSEEAFRRILELQPPSDGSVNLELARTLAANGDIAGAEENFRKAATSPQQRREAGLELARLYRHAGEPAKAVEILSQLLQLYPNDREIEAELNAARKGR